MAPRKKATPIAETEETLMASVTADIAATTPVVEAQEPVEQVQAPAHPIKRDAVVIMATAGAGKSTSILPALEIEFDAPYFGTGDIFKALMTGMYKSKNIVHKEDTLAPNILKNLICLGEFNHYIRMYEYNKQFNVIEGYEPIQFIETLRCIVPDLPSLSVKAIADALDLDLIITDAINFSEALHLEEHLNVEAVLLFECLQPKPAVGVNNRQESFGPEFEEHFGGRVIRVTYDSPSESKQAAITAARKTGLSLYA